jgi:hypothetical protein
MMPTMAPGGRLKVMPSASRLSPKAFLTPLASTTTLPRRGPAGMKISNSGASFSVSWESRFS